VAALCAAAGGHVTPVRALLTTTGLRESTPRGPLGPVWRTAADPAAMSGLAFPMLVTLATNIDTSDPQAQTTSADRSQGCRRSDDVMAAARVSGSFMRTTGTNADTQRAACALLFPPLVRLVE